MNDEYGYLDDITKKFRKLTIKSGGKVRQLYRALTKQGVTGIVVDSQTYDVYVKIDGLWQALTGVNLALLVSTLKNKKSFPNSDIEPHIISIANRIGAVRDLYLDYYDHHATVSGGIIPKKKKKQLKKALQWWQGEFMPAFCGHNGTEAQAIGMLCCLAGLVHKVRGDGYGARLCIFLIGAQGSGKSTTLKALAPVLPYQGAESAFLSTSVSVLFSGFERKDTIQALTTSMVCEFADTANLTPKQWDALKAFITNPMQSARFAYGLKSQKHKIRCLYTLSSNDPQPLSDPTGNTRFLPIEHRDFDEDWLIANRENIWGVVDWWYRAGHRLLDGCINPCCPPDEYLPELEQNAENARERTREDEAVEEFFRKNPKLGTKKAPAVIIVSDFRRIIKKFCGPKTPIKNSYLHEAIKKYGFESVDLNAPWNEDGSRGSLMRVLINYKALPDKFKNYNGACLYKAIKDGKLRVLGYDDIKTGRFLN